jgi:MFS family permease
VSFVGDLRTVLRGADFRKLFAVRLTSQLADGVFQVALASYVFFAPERQTSAPAIAAAFATLLLPFSVIGPFAGVLLDRWSRRQVLFWANAIRVGIVAWIALLVALDVVNPIFFVSALASFSINRFFLAGLSAGLPHTVPRHELVMANAVSPTSGTLAFLVGGASGLGLRKILPVSVNDDVVVVLGAACVYGVAALLALRMSRNALGPDFDPNDPAAKEAVRAVARGFVEGLRHVRSRRPAAAALVVITVHRMGYAIATISTILLYRNSFNEPSDTDAGLTGLATAFGISGLGFMVAALATPIVVTRISKQQWIIVLLVMAGSVGLVLGALYTPMAVLVGAFVLGIASQGIKICVDTIVQEEVDDAYRGRVFSIYDVIFNGAFVAAAAITAVALPPDGKSYPLLIAVALAYGVTAVAYSRVSAQARDVSRKDSV